MGHMRQRAKSHGGKAPLRVKAKRRGTQSQPAAREERGAQGSTGEAGGEGGQGWLLAQIGEGARHCKAIEAEFGKNPPPELETLIKLHRVIVLRLSSQEETERENIGLVTALVRPAME